MSCSRLASEDPDDATQVNCPFCDQLMLHSTQIAVQCHDLQGYHKSRCVTCLLMEMDDCCFEVSRRTVTTIDNYIECKLTNKSAHAQAATDFAIVNFLEFALCSEILVDDVPQNDSQVPDGFSQESPSSGHVCPHVVHHTSPEPDTCDEHSSTETIRDDLSECTSHIDSTNFNTPEGSPALVDDSIFPSYKISIMYNDTLSEDEMSEHIQLDGLPSLKYKR